MRLDPDPRLLWAATLAALSVLPAAHADEHSSINVALKASFPPAPYLVELLYAEGTRVVSPSQG